MQAAKRGYIKMEVRFQIIKETRGGEEEGKEEKEEEK
jgi:hypothetical protein